MLIFGMVDIRTADGGTIAGHGGRIGLALSGGGLKAALFQIGVLARLAELDLLRQVDIISCRSGGSLAAAAYYLRLKRTLDADGDIGSDRLVHLVADLECDLLAAAQTDLGAQLIRNPWANLRRIAQGHSHAKRLGDRLEHQMLRPLWAGDPDRPIAMRDLAICPRGDPDFDPLADNPKRHCKAPVLIINAADLATGRTWCFDAKRMGEPAMTPAAQLLRKTPHLMESRYHQLPDVHAGLTLGQAIAASMAMPALLEPLRLPRLYPDPKQSGAFLDVSLADGPCADTLGTDALLAAGCTRLIVSDASGFEDLDDAARQGTRYRQFEALEEKPGLDLVLVHMLSEIGTPSITPAGPGGHGHIARDRADKDVTSYGVARRLQKLIAARRPDLDAPSDTEGLTLMADGYLIAKRAFQIHRQRRPAWTAASPENASIWRFAALFEALETPTKPQLAHLSSSKRLVFGAKGRQSPSPLMRAFRTCFTALPLTLVALMRRQANRAFLKAGRLDAVGIVPIAAERPAEDEADRSAAIEAQKAA